jgi:hypothetical protein
MASTGVYGTTVPSKIRQSDIDIFYAYHETRTSDSVENSVFKKLPSTVLSDVVYDGDDSSLDNVIEGLYNLKLPLQYFNRKGFYTVYIKPKEMPAIITDVSSLTSFPSVRGIVVDSRQDGIDDDLEAKLNDNNALVGYRVIYINDKGERENYYRLVTSNNRCEPVVQSSNESGNKSYTYRYNESSTLSFLTLTPSSAPSFKSNASPYIGKPTQRIILVNTLFEPVMLDIEMTEHDLNTMAYMLEGSQLRDLDNGLVTTYDENNQIYHQSEHYTVKDAATGKPVFEVRKNKNSAIDFSQTLEDKL